MDVLGILGGHELPENLPVEMVDLVVFGGHLLASSAPWRTNPEAPHLTCYSTGAYCCEYARRNV